MESVRFHDSKLKLLKALLFRHFMKLRLLLQVFVQCLFVEGRIVLFLFKDVEKKMELKSPETPHPREPGHCPNPHPQNAGISILPAPTPPNHVAEAGARVSLP